MRVFTSRPDGVLRRSGGVYVSAARHGDIVLWHYAFARYARSIDGAFGPGVLLHEQGDVAGAKATDQLAIDSGHADQATIAAVNLGTLLTQQGDLAGAKTTYQRAIGSGHWAEDITRQRLRALQRPSR